MNEQEQEQMAERMVQAHLKAQVRLPGFTYDGVPYTEDHPQTQCAPETDLRYTLAAKITLYRIPDGIFSATLIPDESDIVFSGGEFHLLTEMCPKNFVMGQDDRFYIVDLIESILSAKLIESSPKLKALIDAIKSRMGKKE